jgi:hypothetical protein
MSINEIKAKYPCLATKTCTVKQNDEITAAINTGLAWLRARAGAIGAKEGALGAKKSQTHRTPPRHKAARALTARGFEAAALKAGLADPCRYYVKVLVPQIRTLPI